MHLWAEAARTMVYVQNHTPHRVLENKTPEEVFYNKKPEFIHLRIFSYPLYIHIPKEKRKKLDPLGKKGILVGYSESSKAYRIYFLGFKKIDTRRDVIFYEDSSYNILRYIYTELNEENEVPRTRDIVMEKIVEEEHEYHDMTKPQRLVDPTHEKNSYSRILAWEHEAIQDA